MKYAIIGVPEVGKTDLANGLANRIENSVVIDGYVEEISVESGIALGIFASYPGNLAISTGRMAREYASKEHDTTITVGTDIDTMMYGAVDSMNAVNLARNDLEKEMILERSRTLMKLLAFMYIDCGQYDHVFYMPQEIASQDWRNELDANYPDALKLYKIPYTTLTGTPEERLEKALEKINEFSNDTEVDEVKETD